MSKVSIRKPARTAKAQDAALRAKYAKTADSLLNFAANLGIGLNNQLSASTYGFNPITRVRTLLEWIHRGSWLGGVAIDVVAEDMTRAGVDIRGNVEPEDIEHLERAATSYDIWNAVCDTVKWANLYGGCLAVMLIDGQKMETPLKLETVGKGQFKGLLVLDRWMVEPSLNDLVTDMGPSLGLPRFYNVTADAPALPRMKIHYSRCLRLEGIRLPYYQRMMENLWGISVIERLYDRMVAFDSATTGAAQLCYKAYLRTYRMKGLREIIAAGGDAMNNMVAYVDFMRQQQSIEGVTLLDMEDEVAAMTQPSFSGLSDALINFGQQLSGALQIPLVRLFGQSPAGLNATGESDLRMYYDNINAKQRRNLLVPMTRIYRAMAQSEGIKLPEGFTLDFRSLWVLSDQDKATIATADSGAVNTTFNSGIISPRTALQELKQLSKTTGRFTNITKQDIDAASDETSAALGEAQNRLQIERMANAPDEEEESAATGWKQKANGHAVA